MAGNKIYFFSDVHISTNQPVNWYQKSVHQPYVLAALNYVEKQGNQVQDLVLLGDLVDQWTVLPSKAPPGFYEIVKANPDVFLGTKTKPGALVRCLSSVSGNVCYVNGNHDMFLDKWGLMGIRDAAGNFIKYYGVLYRPRGIEDIVALHGHQFSMMCAQDFKNDPRGKDHHGGLPLGHFVTRLCAQWAQNQLKKYPKGSTVADMPNTGYPAGWPVEEDAIKELLETIALDLWNRKPVELSQMVLNVLADIAGVSTSTPIKLFPGYKTTTVKQAINKYGSLFSQWESNFGFLHAATCLYEADFQDKLGHFAKNLSDWFKYRVVIMGHTHKPLLTDHEPWIGHDYLYANSGFNCPSRPDMKDEGKAPTFTELTIEPSHYVVRVLKVGPPPTCRISTLFENKISRTSAHTLHP